MPELFHVEIDAYFHADDIDDALQKLAHHFATDLDDGDDDEPDEPELFIAPSRVDIQSVESKD